jgi:hypothetical protein
MDHKCSPCDAKLWNAGSFSSDHQVSESTFIHVSQSQLAIDKPLFAPTGLEDGDIMRETMTEVSVYGTPLSRLPSPRKHTSLQATEACQLNDRLIDYQVRGSFSMHSSSGIELPKAREHSSQEWDFHKDEIKRLYLIEKMTLRKVMEIMQTEYGFAAK